MGTKSASKRWKESGSDLSFKQWLRQDLNNSVWSTVNEVVSHKDSAFANADGSTADPSTTYKPYNTGKTVLGVNKWIVYGVSAVIAVSIGFVIAKKLK